MRPFALLLQGLHDVVQKLYCSVNGMFCQKLAGLDNLKVFIAATHPTVATHEESDEKGFVLERHGANVSFCPWHPQSRRLCRVP